MAKKSASEEYCFGCECLLLTPDEKHGPFCVECVKKAKRKDPLTQAALRQTLVAVLPMPCPHEQDRGHHCRARFSVVVLDKKLNPVKITGPYSMSAAERQADRIRQQIDRKGKS